MPYRAGAERFWSLCAPSAAKLERTIAVVMTVITVLVVITGTPRFESLESTGGTVNYSGIFLIVRAVAPP